MINSFSGKYVFLSNFYPCPYGIEWEDRKYPCVENAYQAAKLDSTTGWYEDFDKLLFCEPKIAKAIGKKLPLRDDWLQVRVLIMRELLIQKFCDPDLVKQLLETGDEELVEGNWWNDTFWGVCKGKGENTLGKLLMNIRFIRKLETLDFLVDNIEKGTTIAK